MRKLYDFQGGLKLEGHKQESLQQPIIVAPIPARIVLPVHQHIGESAVPVVEIGEHVLAGQMIAQPEGFISAPVHASSSGTVIAIEEHPVAHPSGLPDLCIVIETDGKDEWVDPICHSDDYKRLEPSELRNCIRDAGIVGLGGAGFPSYIKLNPGPQGRIETLILNGAECEPYISCDAALMQERPRDIIEGLLIMRHALQAKQCLIGIEDNKPQAIAALQQALTAQEQTIIEVVQIPTRYPAGSEKQLIKTLTGKELAQNQLPVHHGIVVHNVATAAVVGYAILQGRPLVSRVVTVTGDTVSRPGNYDVRLGTPMHELLALANWQRDNSARLIMGGPMMGFEINDATSPVLKTTNCILSMPPSQLVSHPDALPCIRCGECARVCPANLLPQQLYWFARSRDFEHIQQYHLFDCIECGCCTYVCPSHIPLVQYYRFAKTEIWQQERDRKKSDHARERHEFNQYRAERKKHEDEERRRKKKELLKKSQQSDDKQDAIAAAMARVNARKTAQKNQAQEDASE